MIQLFRCQICGDPYIGTSAPSRCPFCGAGEKFMILSREWKDPEYGLTDISRKNLETALTLEISNSAFYNCAREKVTDLVGKQLFKSLAKIEMEHANAIRKLLKLDSLPAKTEDCAADYKINIDHAHERESKAITFYNQALAEATELWIRTFFETLVEIESDHLALHELALKGEL